METLTQNQRCDRGAVRRRTKNRWVDPAGADFSLAGLTYVIATLWQLVH